MKCFMFFVLLAILQAVATSFSLYPKHIQESKFEIYRKPQYSTARNTSLAVIVSSSSFHLEVTAFFAYLLSQHFQYEVHLWTIGPAFWDTYGNTMISPYISRVFYFTHPYYFHLIENYGKFTDLPVSIQSLVFITAEREIEFFRKHNIFDSYYMKLINRSKNIFMVNHHGDDITGLIPYCKIPSNCSIVHLSKHVHETALSFLTSEQKQTIQTFYLYPLFNLSSLLTEVDWNVGKEKSAFDKLLRLRAKVNQQRASEEKSNIIQLTLPGKIAGGRRNYNELFDCLSSLAASPGDFHLSIIGFGANSLDLPTSLKSFVTSYDRVSNELFYALIQHSDFVLSFLSPDQKYYSLKASSVVPAAMMLDTPIILTKQYLNLYPCLMNQSTFQAISVDDNCQSLRKAFSLTKTEYQRLKAELSLCTTVYYKQNLETVRRIMQH